MHKAVGVVLLGIGAVVILYLASQSISLGKYFGLGTASGTNPSPLTPRILGYDSTGKPVFGQPTTTPYGAANTGVHSAVVNDTILAGSLANFGAGILKLFAPNAPSTQGQITPSAPPSSTLSASDTGTPTLADLGKSVSQGAGAINIDPLTGNVVYGTAYDPLLASSGGAVYGPPSPLGLAPPPDPVLSAAQDPLSAANNPVSYLDFGIPNPVPPASPGFIPGGGNGFTANDFSGYTVPSTVVDLTGVAAPPPPPPDPTVLAI